MGIYNFFAQYLTSLFSLFGDLIALFGLPPYVYTLPSVTNTLAFCLTSLKCVCSLQADVVFLPKFYLSFLLILAQS